MHEFFQKLTDFLEKEIVPVASRLDEEPELYAEVYARFVKLGGLNLLIPKELGGLGGERHDWIEYNILISQYSGALLFLQAQHQYSISQLKKLLPDDKVEKLLQMLAQREQGIGLALQKNKNVLQVDVVPEGYRLSGTFLWTTGFNYFSHLLVSFEQEGTLFYTLLPFQPAQKREGSMTLSSRIETAVFNAVPSHRVVLNEWLIRKEDILATHPVAPKELTEHPSVYNLAGASKALLNMALQGQYGSTQEVLETHTLLKECWNSYYQHILEGTHDPFVLRAEGLQLAERCSLLARTACGAASILKEHPINRLIRETWHHTMAGYSEEQRKAYLGSISSEKIFS